MQERIMVERLAKVNLDKAEEAWKRARMQRVQAEGQVKMTMMNQMTAPSLGGSSPLSAARMWAEKIK